jgi:hypothetical protein
MHFPGRDATTTAARRTLDCVSSATRSRVGLFGVGQPPQVAESATEALALALRLVLEHGRDVSSSRAFREVLNAQLILIDPCSRLIPPDWTTFSLRVAVARVIWHLRPSSKLDEIAFYEPRVAEYSDDGLTVPGSNVGVRLLGGVNQLRAAIDRLQHDASSRRAAMVAWQPDDSVRESRDIPCVFGMTLHVREGHLLVTALMRSNNALRLLPYNVFELALLGDIAASELGLPMGPYVHVCQSLHIFESELDAARDVLDSQPAAGASLPAMPRDDVWGQIRCLVDSEERLRRGENVLDVAAEQLDSYWFAFLAVLAHGQGDSAAAYRLQELAPEHPFLPHLG